MLSTSLHFEAAVLRNCLRTATEKFKQSLAFTKYIGFDLFRMVPTRNRPVQGFGCRTGNSRKLNLNPVCRILPDRKQVFLTENFKLPDLAGNFNFLEYGYLFDRKFLSTKINFFILTQKTTSIITE